MWLGEAGQGSRMKLVVNAYMAILIEGVAEALELAVTSASTPARLAEVIEGGPLDAPIADAKLHKMDQRRLHGGVPAGVGAEGRGPGDQRRRAASRLPLLAALSRPVACRREPLATAARMSAPHGWPWAIRFVTGRPSAPARPDGHCR